MKKAGPIVAMALMMIGAVGAKYFEVIDNEALKSILGIIGPATLAFLGFRQNAIEKKLDTQITETKALRELEQLKKE